jgi:hypothetical protein
MPEKKMQIKIDLTDFSASAKRLNNTLWPRTVVNALADIADEGAQAVRARTKRVFDLHSDYIPRGVKSIPKNAQQKTAAATALEKYGDFQAAVYLRGSTSPRQSLEFMTDHEQGTIRTPHGELIAVPMKGLKKYAYRTSSGAIRKRWKPATLLQRYSSTPAQFDFAGGRTTTAKNYKGPRKRRQPGNAFIIRLKSGSPAIVRRTDTGGHKKRNLEFLYVLKPKEKIKEQWRFVETVRAVTLRRAGQLCKKYINALPVF